MELSVGNGSCIKDTEFAYRSSSMILVHDWWATTVVRVNMNGNYLVK